MEIAVLNIKGEDTGRKVSLNDSIFGYTVNEHAIYLDVKQNLANKRAGTHKSKERAEISRTTKKFKKQKGTGGARSGSLKSPLVRGGGTVFGPRPHSYDFKLNKKLKIVARKSALSVKAKKNEIIILEDFNFEAPRTKNYTDLLNNLKVSNKKSLLVLSETNKNVYLSARNISNASVVTALDINTYDLLNVKNVIILESSIAKIENLLS